MTFPHTSVPVFINKKHPVPYLCKESSIKLSSLSFFHLVIVKYTGICVFVIVIMYVLKDK